MPNSTDARYPNIEDHGIIGDLHTVALVAKDGAIDFMCFPHFDSPSVFASLLDADRGGYFQIAPDLSDVTQKQLYLPDTNVLLTRFLSPHGVAEVTDFMTINEGREPHHELVRRVKTIRGAIRYRMVCAPRFDYARATHRIETGEREVVFISDGEDGTALRLRAPVDVRTDERDAVAEFTLQAGEEAADFVLEEAAPSAPSPSAQPGYVDDTFEETVDFWRSWVRHSTYQGRWREMVNRSALTLKLLTSQPHGSMVAAPTFGLPEEIGGVRNWDYRYTWIRDAAFTLYGFSRLGFTAEATAFMNWLEARCNDVAADESLQLMYGLDGHRDLTETTLDHLEGYKGSRPIRIGNGAFNQFQLDIFGELMDSVYLHDKYGEPIHHDLWDDLSGMIEWVCANWHRPDEGVWEVRSGRQEFLFSRLMCWVAIDRAMRLARKRSLPAPLERWRESRDAIYHDIMTDFWDPRRGAFVQHKQTSEVDASALLMPLVKFISPTDRRWLATLRTIEQDLVEDTLVYRYRIGDDSPDGLSGEEGSFSLCTFWYAECLSRAGELTKARLVFEKMLGYANHLGLYAEELGPSGEQLGNFPQAFTHLALISTAFDLNRRLSGHVAQ